MKKSWLITAFAVCVGFHGFADTLSISFTGGVYLNDEGIAPAEEGAPGQHASELGFAFDAERAGFYGTIEYGNDMVNSPFRDYAAWISLFDAVTVHAGKILYEDYVLSDYFEDNDFNTAIADSEYGLVLTLTAFEDFAASVFLPADVASEEDKTGEEQAVLSPWDDFRPAAGISGPVGDMGTFIVSYRSENQEIAVMAQIDGISDLLLLAGYTGVFEDTEMPLHRLDVSAARFYSDTFELACAFRGELQDGTAFGYGKIGASFPRDQVTPSVYASVQGTSEGGYDETGFGGALEISPVDGAALSAGCEFVYADTLEWGIPVLLSVDL